MANKKLGFVPIYRSIKENVIWDNDDPFDVRSAWIDILLSVNHEKKDLKVGCSVVTIHAGQMWTSHLKLARNWRWSKMRVIRYLDFLKKAGMIHTDSTSNGTLLTVVNWENFNNLRTTNETTHETTNETARETTGETPCETQTIMNNNDNNEKKLRKELEPPRGGGEWQ